MLNSFVDVVGMHEGWSANVVTASSCSPVFGFDVTAIPHSVRSSCADLMSYVAGHYKEYQAVFLTSYWAYQLGILDIKSDKDYLNRLEKTLRIMAETTPIYIFSDIAKLPIHPFRQEYFKRLGYLVHRAPSDDSSRANTVIQRLAEKIPNVYWVNLSAELSAFDDEGFINGKPVYFDAHHLNIYGAKLVGEMYIKSGRRLWQAAGGP